MDWDETLEQLNHNVTVPDAVARWQGDPGSIRHVRTGVNAVFRFERNDGNYYLRITHSDLTEERKVASATRYLSHLWKKGAQVCEPIASKNGQMLESIPVCAETEALPPNGRWMATVTREVRGTVVELEETDLAVFEAWGRCLGSLHLAARTYAPQPDDIFSGSNLRESREDWNRSKQRIPAFDVLALREYKQLDVWQKTLHNTEGHPDFGLTHGDSKPRNMIWDGETVTAIDSDEPSWGWFAGDMARSLVEYWWKKPRHQFCERFLRGYRSVRPFSQDGENWLPLLMRKWALGYYMEWNPYPTPEAMAEADRENTFRPGDFAWYVRKRFANPNEWS